MSETSKLRTVRSFVLRQGRITQSQQTALDQLWPMFGLDPEKALDADASFGRTAPVILEIGFGNGESLAQMAVSAPQINFVGAEVHRPGVGHLLLKIRELGLLNVRVYCADAVEILQNRIPSNSLAGILVYFPDPWHKKRHHKRRLISDQFAELAAQKLSLGGVLHCATDWEDYALHMLSVLESCKRLRNQAGEGQFAERPPHRPLTKFEQRGQRLGHGVWDLFFERIS